MSEKILYGNVTYDSDIEYEWVTEPGACEKCRALDGKRFEHSDEIPDRPHPNCKCRIKVHQTYKDPLKNLRETRIQSKHEQEKLEGDIRVLQDENIAYLNAVHNVIGDDIYKEVLKDIVGAETDLELKLMQDELTFIHNLYETGSLRKLIEDDIVEKTDLQQANLGGKFYAWFMNMPESYAFFKLGINDKLGESETKDTLDYIQKNGHMYNSLSELNNPQEAERILARIHAEKEEKHRTDTRIVKFNPDSSVASAIKNSNAFKAFVKKHANDFINGNIIYDEKIEFTNVDRDLYSTFHGATIRMAYLDKNNNLIVTLEDYYNFNPGRTSLKGRIGYKLEKQGDLIPYYVIVKLVVPMKKYEN